MAHVLESARGDDDRRPWHRHPTPWAVAALVLLVVAVRMLGAATDALTPWVAGWLPDVADGAPSTVGAAWLTSYVVLNGSLVAALAVSFHHHLLVTPLGFFLLVVGARLGASGIVVLEGALLRFRRRGEVREDLHEATRLGILSSLVGLTVYGPIAAVATAVAPLPDFRTDITRLPEDSASLDAASGALLVGSLLLLWVSLVLLDGAAARMDRRWFRRRFAARLGQPWVGAAVGLVATLASASVAVSIGVLVPLFNRGVVTSREAIPYLLGANVGTLSDTLLMAAALGARDSFLTLLVLAALAAFVTATFLLGYRPYVRVVDSVQARLTASPTSFWLTVLAFVVVPCILLLL